MNANRMLRESNPITHNSTSSEIPRSKQLSTKMLFDADEYKATKRSLGHSENEIALELKRLQTSNTYCQPTSSLDRSLNRPKLKLHCSKIDFSGSAHNIEPDYAYPNKQPKTTSRTLYPSFNKEILIEPAKEDTFGLYSDPDADLYPVDKININHKGDKTTQENLAQSQMTVIKPELNNLGKDCDDSSASVKLSSRNPFNKMVQKFGYDFTYHTYLCIGILIAFIIWAAIYFPAMYILRNNAIYEPQ